VSETLVPLRVHLSMAGVLSEKRAAARQRQKRLTPTSRAEKEKPKRATKKYHRWKDDQNWGGVTTAKWKKKGLESYWGEGKKGSGKVLGVQ